VPSCRRLFSPQRSWQQVQPAQTQQFLRDLFGRWGRPARLRTDNGTPWGASGGLPTALELWLAGLGVHVWHNRPRRPQENGVVERSQGTAKRWAEPGQCGSVAQLQRRFDEADHRQRQQYPFRDKRSRAECFPGLTHSGREYSAGWEEGHWDWAAAESLLAEVAVERQVDANGRVSLYSRNVYVGRWCRGQRVYVRYDPEGRRWMCHDSGGQLVGYQSAPEICRERIMDLTAMDSRTRRIGADRKRGQTSCRH
jgi:hypothetical protein